MPDNDKSPKIDPERAKRFLWEDGDLEIISRGDDEKDESEESEDDSDDEEPAKVSKWAEETPRAESGRWTAGTSRQLEGRHAGPQSWGDDRWALIADELDPKNEPPRVNPSPRAKELATQVYAKSLELEPAISLMMRNMEVHGGTLEGFEERVKREASLARKIETDARNDGITLEQAAAKIGDSIRFTFTASSDDYSEMVLRTVGDLEKSGYEVLKFKNQWGEPGEHAEIPPYRGLNVNLKKDGKVIEVQFHSKESFHAKEKLNHRAYEWERLPGTEQFKKDLLRAYMIENQLTYKAPKGAYDLEWPNATLVKKMDIAKAAGWRYYKLMDWDSNFLCLYRHIGNPRKDAFVWREGGWRKSSTAWGHIYELDSANLQEITETEALEITGGKT